MTQFMFWNYRFFLLTAFFLLALPLKIEAKVLFEGYYKIKSQGKHVGFTVHRYEFKPKKKQFHSTYYIRTNPQAGDIKESLKAVADHKFHPISYQYTSQVKNKVKTIDAQFKGQKMTAMVSNGKTKNKVTRKIPKNSFLSTFLGYLMLQQGYKKGKNFSYKAIAEEDAKAYKGQALIKSEVKHRGQKAYRILNTFKNQKFVSLVSPKGEIFKTHSPVQQISTEIVSSPSQATKGLKVNSKALKILFGSVPSGQKHSLAQGTHNTSVVQSGSANKGSNNSPKSTEKDSQ